MIDLNLEVSLLLIAFGATTLAGGIALWVAGKLFKADGQFHSLMFACIIAGTVFFVPIAGTVFSILTLLFLVRYFTSAEIGPAFGMVLISDIVGLGAAAAVFYLLLDHSLFIF